MTSEWHYLITGADRECNHKVGMNGWLARIATIISDRKSGQRGSLGLRQQTSFSTVRLSCRLVPFQLHSCLLHLLVQACRQRPPAWHSHRIFDYLLDTARSCLAPTFFHSDSASSKRMICMPSYRSNDTSSTLFSFTKRADLLINISPAGHVKIPFFRNIVSPLITLKYIHLVQNCCI